MDNCLSVTKSLLVVSKVKFTNKYLEDAILSHPEHPSLLCISDTLSGEYGMETIALKIELDKLENLPLPCIVQFTDHGGVFYVLKELSKDEAAILDEKGEIKSISLREFMERWTGVCLFAEKSEKSGEPGIKEKIVLKRTMNFIKGIALISFLVWIVLILFNAQNTENNTIWSAAYFGLKLAGLWMGTMLLWYEVDKYNPSIQSFCAGEKRIDCDAVLNSKFSKLFHKEVSLGLIGFSYFFGTSLYLLFNGFSTISLVPLVYLSYASLPFVIISLFYQGLVIKQWCKFCLIVQTVLVLEVVLVQVAGLYTYPFYLRHLPLLIAMIFLPVPVWNWLKPLLKSRKEMNQLRRGLKKIKNNPSVLEGLLTKGRKIETNTEDLGISFVNKGAQNHIIKVCNPYCEPCAKVQPILDELVRSGKINLQVLFTATTNEEDRRNKPVRHFLALNEMDVFRAHEAMNDWYSSKDKDYGEFAKAYKLNGELMKQDSKISAMHKWCQAEKITHTPTIFINGYELPIEYSVEDLKEVFR